MKCPLPGHKYGETCVGLPNIVRILNLGPLHERYKLGDQLLIRDGTWRTEWLVHHKPSQQARAISIRKLRTLPQKSIANEVALSGHPRPNAIDEVSARLTAYILASAVSQQLQILHRH
jgi:hypothetical protein